MSLAYELRAWLNSQTSVDELRIFNRITEQVTALEALIAKQQAALKVAREGLDKCINYIDYESDGALEDKAMVKNTIQQIDKVLK